ncbi:hypothetical protein F4818DRAFT_32507 [Hypoxylon cercidicola]|nr:hypothetical protein F4818DRAFT_32507 [Hypoxylon cercidicola]
MSAPTSVHPPLSNLPAPEAPGSSRHAPAPNNATGSSSTTNSPFLTPPFQSNTSRPHPSSSASASRSVTSAPTTAAATATATATAGTSAHPRAAMDLHPTLPSRATQLHVAEARAALVASMSNMLDSELQSRAALLHGNAAALARQERDVARGTAGLRRENDKLERLARDTERKIKELGNVQNWAEVLERDFLVLEETMRIVKGGGRSGSGSDDDGDTCSECSRSTWSGSYSAEGSRAGSRRGSMNGGTDGDAKKDVGEQAANGKSVVNGAVGGDTRKGGHDTKVTVDESVAASISEAMATNLHDAFEPLTLDPTPAPAPSTTQSRASKGKEPATEEISDIDTAPEPVQSPNTSPSDSVEEQMTIDNDSKPTTTTG